MELSFSLPLLVGLAVLLAVSLVASALNLALNIFSRYKLAELLEARGRRHRLDRLIDDCPLLILTTSFLRLVCHLGIMLLVVRMFEDGFRTVTDPAGVVIHYLLIFAVSTGLILVFGVAIPNAWARYAAEPLIAPCIPALHGLRVSLYPIVAFLHVFDFLVRRLAGVPKAKAGDGAEELEREILDAVSEGEWRGAVDETEKEMIESVIELRGRHAGQIMTPRTEVVSVDVEADFEQVRQKVISEGHSRLPVYEDTVDTILGVLYAKDLLSVEDPASFDVRKVMRKVPFVPETKSLKDLLAEFRQEKVHIAVVLDEYGGTAGIVTIEDILEELVGEIADEHELPEPEPVRRIDERTFEVDARTSVSELNDELPVKLPEDDDYDTIGGFVFSRLGRIPRVGEEFEHGRLRFKILDAEERRIKRVRIEALAERDGD